MKKIIPLLIALQAVTMLCYSQVSSIPYGKNPYTGRYYKIRGFKIYCEVYGEGTPVLMIHGNGGSIAAFSQTIPYFEDKYMVIAVDSRAQGKSIDKSDSLTFEMMADDFSVLLDSLHIKKTYVIGWSDGGICALLLAIRHPDQVIKLASTGANLWPGYEPISSSEWKSMQRQYRAQLRRTWPTAVEKNDWKISELDDFQPNIPLAALRQIKCPSLIICGDRDVIPVKHTVLISKNIPKGHLWIVPNSGHATLIEHSDEFNEKVDNFFSH